MGVKQYNDVACFDQSGLRQLINSEGGQLSPELERKLKIRRKGDGVFYTAGDEEIRLATVVEPWVEVWHWSTSCRHIAIGESGGSEGSNRRLYFYELVE